MKRLTRTEVAKVKVRVINKGYIKAIASLKVGEGLLVKKSDVGTYFAQNAHAYAKGRKVRVLTTVDGKSWLVKRIA